MTSQPTLTFLEPDAPYQHTLVVLHGNAMTPEEMRPFYEDLTEQGWRVALACSGQERNGQYIWNDFAASDAAIRSWATEVSGKAYWSGFSAAAYFLLKNALQGQLPAAGLLCVAPSLLRHETLWPTGWTEKPAPVPTAFVLGDGDEYLAQADTDGFIRDVTERGVPTRIWRHSGEHEHPAGWPQVRAEALQWLVDQAN